MNRDGWRADRMTAEHEAAHAVVAVLSGMDVCEVTIAPPKRIRGHAFGFVAVFEPEWPIPVTSSPTSMVDTYAAGLAWELLAARSLRACREAWSGSAGDRESFTARGFAAGTVRATRILRRPHVAASVLEVADLLQSRKSGSIFGVTVERVLLRRSQVPALDESWRAAA